MAIKLLYIFFLLPLLAWPGLLRAQQPPFADAHWISPLHDTTGTCPVFRKEFNANKPVKYATLYITSHGLCEAQINRKRVGNRYFTPGFTPYDKELFYNTYDVTGQLKKQNTITATIADGWYRGIFGPMGSNAGRPNVWGRDASLLAKLIITYKAVGSAAAARSSKTKASILGKRGTKPSLIMTGNR